MTMPFSQACENNKQPILEVLKTAFSNLDTVLEVGSGTGQHAVYMAEHLPHLVWQPSDQALYLEGVKARCHDYAGGNLNEKNRDTHILINHQSPIKSAA